MYLISALPNVYYEKIVANFQSAFHAPVSLPYFRELKVPEFVFRSVVLHLHKMSNEI